MIPDVPRASRPRTTALACAALLTSGLGLGGAALAAPDPPKKWGAWNADARPLPAVPSPWTTDPLELEAGGFALDAKAQELGRAGAWGELVDLLARAADGLTPVRTPAQGPLLGPREAVRRRLLALPPAARRSFDELVEGRVKKLLATPAGPHTGREEALAELLERYGATPRAALAARLLGERLLERGDVGGAALLWRRALAEARDPVLERRLLALRTALPLTVEGSLAAPRSLTTGSSASAGPRPWGVLWGRPAPGGSNDGLGLRGLAVDGHHVYLTDHRGLIAVERDTGRLVWRTSLRGDPKSERLFVGHGRVLLLRRDRAVGVDAERGVVLWRRALPAGGDRYGLEAAVTPIGFALLASIDGYRHVLGIAPDGRTLFDARLWQAREAGETHPIRRRASTDPPAMDDEGQPLPAEFEDGARERLVPAYPVGLPGRLVADDGRLAALGDRLVVDADGIVATLSTAHGGVVWIRDAGGGLEVAGARVLPAVAAGPFAIEAVTAAGHLVRLDPLDGRTLESPAPPEGTWPEPPEPRDPRGSGGVEAPPGPQPEPPEPRPYVLGLSPLVLAWNPEGGRAWITVGCPPRKLLPLEPTTLSAVVGQVLALPDPEGVVLVDLATGLELGDPLPWCLRQGPLVAVGGLIFSVGPDGVVAYGPGGQPGDDPVGKDELKQAPPDTLTRLLEDDAWRTRQAARDALAARELDAGGDLRRAAREALTADARDAARGLLERLERKRLFTRLIPTDKSGTLIDLIEGRALAERLTALQYKVNADPKGLADPELERMFLEQDDPDVKYALGELLVLTDANLRRRLLATLCDPRAEKLLRVGSARALAELAARERHFEPLQRITHDEDLDEGTWAILMSVAQSVGQTDPTGGLTAQLQPTRQFEKPPAIEEFSRNAARARLLEALPGLLDDR